MVFSREEKEIFIKVFSDDKYRKIREKSNFYILSKFKQSCLEEKIDKERDLLGEALKDFVNSSVLLTRSKRKMIRQFNSKLSKTRIFNLEHELRRAFKESEKFKNSIISMMYSEFNYKLDDENFDVFIGKFEVGLALIEV